MKTWIKLPVIGLVLLFVFVVYADDSALEELLYQPKLEEAQGTLVYGGKTLYMDRPMLFVDGRLYLPLLDAVRGLGGTGQQDENSFRITWGPYRYEIDAQQDDLLIHSMVEYKEAAYFSLYDLTQLFKLAVVFDSKSDMVTLYPKAMPEIQPVKGQGQPGRAYLRLEDITADDGAGSNSSACLEKLRAIADYLCAKGQEFSIAWIPLYTNPQKGIQNDLTAHFNFYNADFLYTLDYITGHNGHIILHGLTHQEKDTVSAIGTEFGQNSPFTDEEIDQRMARAKQIADIYGYESNAFEFPHYAATKTQLKIAEKYFDIIYQQDYRVKSFGHVERTEKFGRDVIYVPTPLDYVESADKLEDMLDRIDALDPGQTYSLFMHPYLEFPYITCSTLPTGERTFQYDEGGIIPQLVEKMTEKNLAFSHVGAELSN